MRRHPCQTTLQSSAPRGCRGAFGPQLTAVLASSEMDGRRARAAVPLAPSFHLGRRGSWLGGRPDPSSWSLPSFSEPTGPSNEIILGPDVRPSPSYPPPVSYTGPPLAPPSRSHTLTIRAAGRQWLRPNCGGRSRRLQLAPYILCRRRPSFHTPPLLRSLPLPSCSVCGRRRWRLRRRLFVTGVPEVRS